MPRTASETATTTSSHSGPATSSSHTQTANAVAMTACTTDEQAEREGVAEHEVALAHRRREQPLEGARLPFAQGRDRGDDEHDDHREDPEQRGPDVVEDRGAVVDPGEQADQHAGHDDDERDGAVVGAHLARARGPAVATVQAGVHEALLSLDRLGLGVDEGEEGGIGVGGAGAREQPRRGDVGEHLALAQQHEPVAAGRLVHDVARDDEGVAALGEVRGRASHRSRRSTGSRPTVGSSSTSSVGRPTRAAASETRDSWPPERSWTSWSAYDTRSTSLERAVDGLAQLGAAQADGAAEVGDVVAHAEVGVDARALGDVADLGAQHRRAGRVAEHGDGARLDDLHPDEAAHQRRLARARRPEQAHDLAGGDLEIEPGDDAALAAHDLQAAHGDRRSTVIHHVMKSTPAPARLSTRWCWSTGPMRSTSCSGVASAIAGTRMT